MGNCLSIKTAEFQEPNDQHGNNVVTVGSNGFSRLASLYSQKGSKDANQDAAVVYQGFGEEGGVLCGVFDGHGMHGHRVSKLVRNRLPGLILEQQKGFSYDDYGGNVNGEHVSENEWRRACVSGFKVMDKELKLQDKFDSSCSGSTAVTIIIQSEYLIIANIGDSRAVLGTISDNNELIAVQLTTDQKPQLPNESERIRRCNGEIYALKGESSSLRVWVPNEDHPGLAMSRAFGDLNVKNYGVIAVPQMSFHRLSKRDQFVVLATDGVWDVLSNDQVTSIVWSVESTEAAAQAVVNAATAASKQKLDDCTAVCFFFQDRNQESHFC